MPIAHWFRGPLRTRIRSAIESTTLHDTGYFNRGALERLVDEHERAQHDHSAILWLVLVFQVFLEHLAEIGRSTFDIAR